MPQKKAFFSEINAIWQPPKVHNSGSNAHGVTVVYAVFPKENDEILESALKLRKHRTSIKAHIHCTVCATTDHAITYFF